MKKLIRRMCGIILCLVIPAGIIFGMPALIDYGEVRAFKENKEQVEFLYSDEELERAREIYQAFHEDVLSDSIVPIDHYVEFWFDGGYDGVYRVLLKNKKNELELKEYKFDSLLASNVAAYIYAISDEFPSKLGFNYLNNVVIRPSDPEYAKFMVYTTEVVREALNSD